MIGRLVSRYRIEKQIGSGGMGKVYLAEDTKLDRSVALKILPQDMAGDPERMRRFVQEAKAASALNHPNVSHIYEIGEAEGVHFIAMEYIDGQTLEAQIGDQPLDTAMILDVGIQITDALDHAHSKGIIHRDIKAANIMLTPRGQAKVLDFGLAKMTQPSVRNSTMAQTDTGVVMGTVDYMSPEQALGEKVDQRSDIFSLGVLLYRMATGRLPFSGKTVTHTLSKILHDQPDPIPVLNHSTASELERIIRKCLEKDANRRYQSAHELLTDLNDLKGESGKTQPARLFKPVKASWGRLGLGALVVLVLAGAIAGTMRLARAPAIDSVAVLPFVNAGGDPNMEYLSDGITESTINRLSRIRELKVMARATVFTYKGKVVDPRQLRKDLDVDAVVTGNIRQQGDNLFIQVDLVDTADGSQIWGEQYSRRSSDILVVQSEISSEIYNKLRLKLTGVEQRQVAEQYTDSAEAYQLYLKGRFYWNKRTAEGFTKAIQHFNEAIGKDPNYALAYAGLADCYNLLIDYGGLTAKEAAPKAKAAALKAIELNDTLSEAHTSLGWLLAQHDWDWPGSERELRRAIELNPNYSTAHQWYAFQLLFTGRSNEGLAEIRRAQELDPLSLIINADVGAFYYYLREYDRAIEQSQKTLELDSNFAVARHYLACAKMQKGQYKEAIAAFQEQNDLTSLGFAYALSGHRADALDAIEKLKALSKGSYVAPGPMVIIYSGLGEKDKAFDWLQKAYEQRDPGMVYLKVEPSLDPLRSDPRFTVLLQRVNLPP